MEYDRYFDSPLVKVAEYVLFRAPESVGTIRVKEVTLDNKDFPGFDKVLLDFGVIPKSDTSAALCRIPHDLVKEGQITEVLIRRASGISFESLGSAFFGRPKTWLVAIRPYEARIYGNTFNLDTNTASIFVPNAQSSTTDTTFYKRFVEDRTPKIFGIIR